MPAIIILLITLGLLGSPEEWNNLSPEEQEEMTEIIETDIIY
jgi:hypothetical protein